MRTILIASIVSSAIYSVLSLAAQPAQVGSAQPLVSGNMSAECQLSGSPSLALDVPIFAKEKGDAKVARFTGMSSGLTILELPDSNSRRIHVVTGKGHGGFAIDGWVKSDELPLYAATNLPVVPGHVWIHAGQRVEFEGRQNNQIRVQRTTTSPFSQTFVAATNCGSLSIVPINVPPPEIPRFARGYSLDHNELSISSEPKGDPSFKLTRTSSSGSVFLYGTDIKNDWVRIRHFGVIGIDAWAKLGDLRQLPKGERVNEYVPSPQTDTGRLRIVESGRIVTVSEKVQVRLRPSPDAPVIGEIEPATETQVLDVAAGWASVLPKGLNVAPPADQQFWVEARKVGIVSKISDWGPRRPTFIAPSW